ncbi:MAG: molybdopterin-dependent oxidoreductase [Pirellulaceae bacterium]
MKTQTKTQTQPAEGGLDVSRRQMILGSGILLAGLSQNASSAAATQDSVKDLIFRTEDPRNAEPALNKLIASWITPTKHFYVRSHAPNPQIDPEQFRLSVEGMVDRDLSLSMEDIKSFKEYTITATLTCAGNRREEFNAEGKVGGVQWEAGAIGNATWTGVSLAEVLRKAAPQSAAKHVWFEGLDEIAKGDGIIPFGASIPIEKLEHENGVPGAMLVYGMNGAPLTADHGFPLRTLVPGYIGARSVKWVGKVILSDRTSPNHYLATAYKIVRKTDSIDWSEAGPIYRYLVNAAVGSHSNEAELKAGEVELAGYVLPSGIVGTRIASVEVSADAGVTWSKAELTGRDEDFCWQLWKAKVQVDQGTSELIVRAKDSSGGFMPERVPWNAKGYLQNSWYRLPVSVQ